MGSGKYHIHIEANNYEDLSSELKELAYVMTGLREATKKWQDEYGARNRDTMKYWEAKADVWIEKHKIYNDADN